METTVERIRRYCKEKGVAVSVLEKDLGFGNGYLNPKKIEDINTDRLLKILDYLGISAEEFFNIGSKQTQIIETAIVQEAGRSNRPTRTKKKSGKPLKYQGFPAFSMSVFNLSKMAQN